jgi:hypothetical protein
MELDETVVALKRMATTAIEPDGEASRPVLTKDDIDALNAAVVALSLKKKRQPPMSAGSRWDDAEDARLCEEFDNGLPLPDIAATHGRSRTAIT